MQGRHHSAWRLTRIVAASVVGVVLALYSIGMGVYAVASTRSAVATAPRTSAEADAALAQLDLTAEYPFSHGFVETPHGRMHYAESGAGRPVLMLHGSATWSFVYRGLMRELSSDYRAIAPDLIGFGLSEKDGGPNDYTLAGHVDDVSALIEALDLRGITLVVQEWGGPIGLGVLLRHADRIDGLVVMNTFGFTPRIPAPRPGPALAVRAARVPWMGEQLVQGLGIVQRVVLASSLDSAPLSAEREDRLLRAYLGVQGSWAERAGVLAFPRLAPASPSDPAAELLAQSAEVLRTVPPRVLLLWGTDDPLFGSEILDEWRRVAPHAQVVELPGAGQLLLEQSPVDAIRAMRRFIEAPGRVAAAPSRGPIAAAP